MKEILAQEPTRCPRKLKRSPAPFVHAATKAMRRGLWEACAWFVSAYRDAAEKLRAGDLDPPFPAGCFPPARPFVSAWEQTTHRSTVVASPEGGCWGEVYLEG